MNFRFGPFSLDLDTRQLLRGDDPIHVSPKAFELLRLLVEVRPRALSKSELHDQLWPGTFVSDPNLAILIAEIRRALGDDPRKPRYVRTLHGFGYAFSGTAIGVARSEPRMAGTPTHWLIWRRRKFALTEGENVVGRSPEAAIWLDVPGVSREHARITVHGESVTIEDLGSRNGTFRGSDQVSGPIPLDDRDRIRLGPVLMTFRVWRPGAGTKTQDLI